MKKLILTAAVCLALLQAQAQPGGGIEFTPPPVFIETEQDIYEETQNFAIRKEGHVSFVTFVTSRNDTLNVPFVFCAWSAEKKQKRKMAIYVDDMYRGYPKLTFYMHIDCEPKIDYFLTTKVKQP